MAGAALARAARRVKRFYRQADAVDGEVRLDGRPVRTPGRRPLAVPSVPLAQAIADEWAAQGDRVDPATMKLTGLANAAIDRVAPDPQLFARGLAAYGESDLLCYRADAPPALVERESGCWDPIVAWARRRYDVDFALIRGIIHRPQPRATIERLGHEVAMRPPFELAGLAPLVTISGSLVIALALAEGAIGVEPAWSAASLGEQWQAEHWGEDAEAAAALEARRRDFNAAARFLALLNPLP
jgi:chaperone required for assembly of F1-ATPase